MPRAADELLVRLQVTTFFYGWQKITGWKKFNYASHPSCDRALPFRDQLGDMTPSDVRVCAFYLLRVSSDKYHNHTPVCSSYSCAQGLHNTPKAVPVPLMQFKASFCGLTFPQAPALNHVFTRLTRYAGNSMLNK